MSAVRKKSEVSLLSADKAIGRKLAALRAEKGIERSELARRTDLLETELSAYEEGKEEMPASILLVLSRELDVHPLYFYEA